MLEQPIEMLCQEFVRLNSLINIHQEIVHVMQNNLDERSKKIDFPSLHFMVNLFEEFSCCLKKLRPFSELKSHHKLIHFPQ